MAKVLFIENNLRSEKLGIMYISAVLKKANHETKLCRLEEDDLNEMIKTFSPEFIAFSLTTGSHKKIISLAKNIKENNNVKIIFGGPHATFFYNDLLESQADFIVVGQGEKAVLDIVEGNVVERVIKNNLVNLDTLPFPDRSLFYCFEEFRNNPMKNIITYRDCPYSCSYCYNHAWKEMFQKEKFFLQRRSVENVIEEIKEIKKEYFLEKVLFIDDNFLVNESWIENFCVKYKEEINLPFLCSLRANLVNENKLKMLKEAGLEMVNFALESADQEVQKDILNRGNITNKQVIDAISLLKKYNIKIRMQNMIGLPLKESFKDALNTLMFNKKYTVDDSWVSIFQPYPNTKLADYAIKNGFIKGKIEDCIADSFFNESFLDIDHPEETKRLQKWWYFIVKYDIDEKLINFLLKIEFNQEIGNEIQKLRYEFAKKDLYNIKTQEDEKTTYNEEIIKKLESYPNYKFWEQSIKEYKFCYGISEILVKLNLSEELIGELVDLISLNGIIKD